LGKSWRGSHVPEDAQSLPAKEYWRSRFPGVNFDKTVSVTTTVFVYVRNNPQLPPTALTLPGDDAIKEISAINCKAGKFNALYLFALWETIFLRLPGE
jgi:hypothetical protein